MGFNRFYLHIVIRIILIVITGILLAFFLSQEDKIMASIITVILLTSQTVFLIKYINKTNADLAAFLVRISSKDTAVNYLDDQVQKNFKGLKVSFDKINKELQQARIENEQKTNYLNTIVKHIKVGIIAWDDHGKIHLFNPEAMQILQCDEYKLMSTLEVVFPTFHQAIRNVKGEKTELIKLNSKTEILSLAIKKTLIAIGTDTIHIITFQNIRRELDYKEMESWHKLIRVLNHEIMNSITPITSLSRTIQRYIHKDGEIKPASEISDSILKDIAINTEIIGERGKGLIDFIEVYKNITNNPKLNISSFNVNGIIQKVAKFYRQKFEEQKITFESSVNPDIEIEADEALIEQMLINLFKNALEAVQDKTNPMIRITANKSVENTIIIKIEDNGNGIPESEQDKIFIPFYSTKESGSGIGLSLSRQIMHLHKGSINYLPSLKNTTFVLEF